MKTKKEVVLKLKKKTIANLSAVDMETVQGGKDVTGCIYTACCKSLQTACCNSDIRTECGC
jgi:hypothetical protein